RVDLLQREARRARLIADRVGRQAAIVLAIDVVHAEREGRNHLLLAAAPQFTRAADLRTRIDGVPGWSEHAGGGVEACAVGGGDTGQLVALDDAVVVGVGPAGRAGTGAVVVVGSERQPGDREPAPQGGGQRPA